MPNRRHALKSTASMLVATPLLQARAALALEKKDSVVIGMTLEPTGLDPTAGAASAIAEVVLYNVFETLTKVHADGTVSPLLARSWEISPDLRTYTFKLRKGVRFQNGEPCNAQAVKFSFDRAAHSQSTNKDRRTFASMQSVSVVDDETVVIINTEIEPDFLFLMGQATAIIVEPRTAAGNDAKPVGTGPFRLERWVRGSSLTLARWNGFRDPNAIRLSKVTFRFISEPASQVAALLSGDVDVFPRVSAGRSMPAFRGNPRFQVVLSGSRAKTILAMNNKRKPLDDIRVRRAIAMAIDRKAVIQGAADGYGVPIGAHYVPTAPGYVDVTGVNPYDPGRAQELLGQAGIVTPLELTLVLPPPGYARQGGEVIAAQLARIGVIVKIQNVEWANWLSDVYGNKNYSLTMISHAEPFDLGNFAKPGYYWNYESPKFKELYDRYRSTPRAADRSALMGALQRLLAEDCVHAFLYQPQWITVAHRNVRGLWKDMPLFVNDLSALSWV